MVTVLLLAMLAAFAESDSPQDVVEKFRNSDRYNLVVLDDDGSYVGFLSRANLFSAYRRFVRDVSEE